MDNLANQLSEQFARWTTGRRGYVMAIDQGTTSTRSIVFNAHGEIVTSSQLEHRQILPHPGWLEHDPEEIRKNVRRVLADSAAQADITTHDIAALGITNQRETTIVWERETGRPIYNAIVWQDTRTDPIINRLTEEQKKTFRRKTGLPASTYFAGPKIRWILDHVEGAQERAERGELVFGTIDTWLVWDLARKNKRYVHITDVTNASRTMLMNLETLDWDQELLDILDIPRAMLPEIVSSSEVVARVQRKGPLHGVPIAGILGDQQAASFGQACHRPGEAKNTYGTGNFLLLNTGTTPQFSEHGLLTTVAYRIGQQPAVYALEGSIAVTGSLVQWLRDNLGFFNQARDIEPLARSVEDNGGCYIVPAFTGLLSPHWRPEARGVITGLTRYVTKAHLARAALESTAFQTREVVEAMNKDSGVPLKALKVDGGMVENTLLMQIQANQLGVPVTVPKVSETTALGAAFAAGLAVGFFPSLDAIWDLWQEKCTYSPDISPEVRDAEFAQWTKAVQRTFDWA
ncbi:glycerol kinase GlpK [Corynebacterium sp. zg254]|uniref:glycerol kinase GlpK n=1 Tax=Corynebacterium sp. zg254 TaxID=2656645 RepID=UPI002151C437|nr:glycerol kinase GlpK [Corynebacterium sp. zg254]MCR5913978.1 glycerol kinase GlpK [Corynebacterium sp. zg254]